MALFSAFRPVFSSHSLPVYDFLAPSLFQIHRAPRSIRHLSTTPQRHTLSNFQNDSPSTAPRTPKTGTEATSNPASTSKPLTQAQRDFLSRALRVNQTGELAAVLIYAAQTPVIVASHPHLRPLMKHMYDQEAGHFVTWNALLSRHRVRPTALYPVWTMAATVLGWGTAVMGREAAMACTEAVETVIGGHYNEQVGGLLEIFKEMEAEGVEVGEDLRVLVESVRRIRDEELEHLDHALENDAQKAVPHELLTGVIRAGCRGAIWVSERV
ncbi:5-demethoxyubiquinone hydroxylase, mitochondrial [Lachnellula hyalina]|uniref:5-demethoxyubiquinone hydroxylase, mitochondrial n=1 Tax=Lachnellula hyalina TaxID=1316788 RepID=A0A8H8U312_9HELO|nr:5-demethoxyubiquinone hydroxylase, mitochondrial [Lachnellula hyalina]TVY29573.1 5-demethoxyubiquinone hydroxylase, mitochondrial [Lachnellula hyalina]